MSPVKLAERPGSASNKGPDGVLNKGRPGDSFAGATAIRDELKKILGNEFDQPGQDAEHFAALDALKREDQLFIVRWADIISQSHADLAINFVSTAPRVFAALDQAGVEAWLMAAMQLFDNDDLQGAVDALTDPAEFMAGYIFRLSRCTYDSVGQFLQHFVIGLGGRELTITKHHEAYTDTERVFLPDQIKEYAERDLNFSLYKLITVHMWAQTRYGMWRYQALDQLFRVTNSAISTDIFNRLECIRLDACIARDLPGIHRQFEQLAYYSDEHKREWDAFKKSVLILTEPAATALDSIAMIEGFSGKQLPQLKRYQGRLDLANVRKAMLARIEREKSAVQEALGELQRTIQQMIHRGDAATTDDDDKRFSLMDADDQSQGDGPVELRYDDQLVEMTPEIEALMESILQDFGEIPEHYLDGISSIPYASDRESDLGEIGLDTEEYTQLDNTIRYREWDYLRQRYREGYCLLNEHDVPPVDDRFVEKTLEKYSGLLKSIKKTFEAVLGESKLLRKQSQGDDIDLDALVEAQADFASGREMSDNVYTRYRNRERSIAVMFMVDMSGSTHGWINDAERESLILLCEALETLGDRYAIYGFSGRTNKRCETYRIKRFDEAYSSAVRQRISGIRAKGFTRMGVAIRHLGHLLNLTRARTKILITLSDGRPEDYDAYRGRYAVEDTRHALLELRHEGIHSFCITIDKEAQDYLPHMYGAANYTVIHEVKKLPLKVADIYRRLTTL